MKQSIRILIDAALSNPSPRPPRRGHRQPCVCGACHGCRRRQLKRLRQLGWKPLPPKWEHRYARTEEERTLCRIFNDPDWAGPSPLPVSISGLLAEAAVLGTTRRAGPKRAAW